jgi:hypothetical protein
MENGLSVKIELLRGKVTKVTPWTNPARLRTRFSALDAMSWVAAYGLAGNLRRGETLQPPHHRCHGGEACRL